MGRAQVHTVGKAEGLTYLTTRLGLVGSTENEK